MRHERFGDLSQLEEAYWRTHPDQLPARTARKPSADEQEGDLGDDPEGACWPEHVL